MKELEAFQEAREGSVGREREGLRVEEEEEVRWRTTDEPE